MCTCIRKLRGAEEICPKTSWVRYYSLGCRHWFHYELLLFIDNYYDVWNTPKSCIIVLVYILYYYVSVTMYLIHTITYTHIKTID